MSVKEDLRKGEFKSAYLLWGQEDFLKDYYKKAVLQKADMAGLIDFNYMEIIGEKPDTDKVSDFLCSYPFMGEKKILFIKNSGLFKKASEQDKEFWQKTLSDVPDFAIIIFCENEVDKRSTLYKQITKEHSCDEFDFQSEANLCDWIRRYSESLKKIIGRKEAEYLIKSCSPSMYILKGEIDKLSSFCADKREITIEDIDLCSCKIPEDRVFDMIDDLICKKETSALAKYEELKLLRQEPVRILAAIFMKFEQLRKIKVLSSQMGAKQIAQKCGMKEYFVTKDISKLSYIALKKIDQIIVLCHEADHKIKSGISDGWVLLDMLVANIADQN